MFDPNDTVLKTDQPLSSPSGTDSDRIRGIGDFAGIGPYPTVLTEDGREVPAQITLLGNDDPQASRDHMAAVQARYAELATPQSAVQMRSRMMDIASKASPENRRRLLTTANKAKTAKQRVHWLRQEADLMVRAASASSACSAGCSSCCHMAVAVAEQEARTIAQECGLVLREPPPDRLFTFDLRNEESLQEQADMGFEYQRDANNWNGAACPFLGTEPGRGCTIYKSRPLACRSLINLDRDDVLCKLVTGAHIRVPYLSRTDAQIASLFTMGPVVRIADIRDWFGAEKVQLT